MDISGTTTTPTTTSTTVANTRDHVYCLELAKRSVARAALHLGVPSMENDVLNVLGDVLCEYLQRMAAVLAQTVESSGRSSQHVNSLDALRAVELCTSPAVSRVHFTSSGRNGNAATAAGAAGNDPTVANGNPEMMEQTTMNGNNSPRTLVLSTHPHPPGSWQGLAAFCFGPTWHEQEERELEVAELQGAGGKVGPKAANQQEESSKDCQEGWRAPFPDEVPPFPACSTSVNNPHAMTQTQVLTALYGKEAPPATAMDLLRGKNLISAEAADQERTRKETVLNQMPESAWGGVNAQQKAAANAKTEDNTNKKSAEDGGTNNTNNNTSAKRKLEEEDATKKDEAVKKEEGDKMDTSDDKANTKKDKDDAAGQPPKKKVKLEDGSAKAKTATPKKKKSKKEEKEGAEQKEAAEKEKERKLQEEAAAKANQHAKGPTGPSYNYVPTFFPPIPTMTAGADANKLCKTTVVDLLEQKPAATKNTTGGAQPATKTHGLRTALVQLGTSYWGSQAEAEPTVDDGDIVPAGRSGAAAPPQGPIVPLGRASGSRVSRILEGSMDAATMQQ